MTLPNFLDIRLLIGFLLGIGVSTAVAVALSTAASQTTLLSVSGGITADGEIESQFGGFVFPDGTVQTTAAIPSLSASASGSLTANAGLYENRIPDILPPFPYSEICFKNTIALTDVHELSEPTAGGNCAPGDIGWIIERETRGNAHWATAKGTCLRDGMRLPEPFEIFWSTLQNSSVQLIDPQLAGWASNSAIVVARDTEEPTTFVSVPVFQGIAGQNAEAGVVAPSGSLVPEARPFRCAL